jgi:hypothetical protein
MRVTEARVNGVPPLRPVAIATLHYGHNEGSILQAYSVAQAVARHVPAHGVEILDQRYPGKLAIEKEPTGDRQIAIRRAADGWLPLSPERFLSESHAAALDYVRRHCSAIVVGSDVLWRFRFFPYLGGFMRIQRPGFYTPVPNVYWPDDSVNVPRISYAASVGASDWRHMPFGVRRRLRRILSGFAAVSVRDTRTLRFLEWLDKSVARRTALVPDPTWATDLLPLVDAEELKARLVAAGVDFSRPRAGFVTGSCDSARSCADHLRRRGYQIIGITTANDFSDVRLCDHGFHPLQWARLFGFMDLVVSERMHGTIFCLQNDTPVVALDINDADGDPDTKIVDLFRGFGLDRFCLPKTTSSAAQLIAACEDVIAAPWNWPEIAQQRARHRRTADVFLQQLKDLVPG